MESPDSELQTRELERHGDFLRRLGFALLGDEQLAEDVAQSALLAWLQAPPRAVRDARAWTAGVARNLARKLQRGDARRAERERAAAPEERGEDPRASSLRGVADAVLTLSEPYRGTVLARYFEGLSPAEIARRDGVPVATVKSRLARALARLRERLDREHGGRDAWCVGLVALIGRDAASLPLAEAAETAGPGGGGAAPSASAGGIAGAALVTTQTKLTLLAATALAVVLGLVALDGLAESGADTRTAGAPPDARVAAPAAPARDEPLAAAPASGAPDARLADAGEPARRAVHSGGAEAAASIDVLVVRADGTAAPGAFVRAMPWGSRHPWLDATYERADASGRVRLVGLPPGTTAVYGQRGGFASATLAAGEHAELRVRLPDGVDVTGTVVDEAGLGVSGAEIWLSDAGNGSAGLQVATADHAGRFFLRDVTDQHVVGARHAGFGPSSFHWIAGAAGEALELRLVLPRDGARLPVRVVDPLGAPVAGAVLRLEGERAPAVRSDTHLSAHGPIPRELRTDADGRATFEGLSPSKLELVVSSHALAPRRLAVDLGARGEVGSEVPGTDPTLVVELDRGFELRGTAVDGAGEPLAGVAVRAGGYADLDSRSVRTRVDGSYRLAALAAGELVAFADARERGKDQARLSGAVGDVLTWNPVIVSGRVLQGRLVDERGEPCVDWWVVLHADDAGFHAALATDAQGRFRAIGCPAEPMHLRAYEHRFGAVFPDFVAAELLASDAEVSLVVPDAGRGTATLRGRVLDAEGLPAAVAGALYRVGSPPGASADAGAGHGLRSAHPDGTFELGPVPAGEYALRFEAPDGSAVERSGLHLGTGAELDLGDLVLGAPGRLVVEAPERDGLEPGEIHLQVIRSLDETGHAFGNLSDYDAGLELPPGTYVLHVGGRALPESHPLEIRSGRTTTLTLAPRRGERIRFEVEPPEDLDEPWLELEATFTFAGGEAHRSLFVVEQHGAWWAGAILPDAPSYRVVLSGHGLVGEAEVAAGAATSRPPARLVLRRP